MGHFRPSPPLCIVETRFLELARAYAGQPAAMEAVQWLAESANPGPVFDEGLVLVEQHHLEGKGLTKLCRTLVFRRSSGVERFLLEVAKKHGNRDVRGLAYLSLGRYLKNFYDFAVALEKNEEAWLNTVKPVLSDDTIAWLRAADRAKLSARVDELCEKVISEYGDVSDDEYRDAIGQRRVRRYKTLVRIQLVAGS